MSTSVWDRYVAFIFGKFDPIAEIENVFVYSCIHIHDKGHRPW